MIASPTALRVLLLVFLLSTAFAWQVPGAAGDPWPRHAIDDTLRGADGVKLADFDGNGKPDVVTSWEQSGITRVYLHPGASGVRELWPSVQIGKTADVEDAIPVDLDGDGRLDVLSLCEGKTAAMFMHWGGHSGDMRSVFDAGSWHQQRILPPLPKMKWMFAAQGTNPVDSQSVLFAAGKGQNASIGRLTVRHAAHGDGDRLRHLRWQPLSPVGWTMSIVPLDMDGDGDEDVLLSDRRGDLRGVRWLENPLPDQDESGAWQNHFVGGHDREVMLLTAADWDDDGGQDVLAAIKPAGVLWFRRLDGSGKTWESNEISYPQDSGTAKAVAVGDLDRDGLSDLVVTCEQADDEKSGIWWFERTDVTDPLRGNWQDISGPEGIKYDLVELIDIDDDSDLDVLTCEEAWRGRGLGVVWYENLGQ